jgi:hypothetical protein
MSRKVFLLLAAIAALATLLAATPSFEGKIAFTAQLPTPQSSLATQAQNTPSLALSNWAPYGLGGGAVMLAALLAFVMRKNKTYYCNK